MTELLTRPQSYTGSRLYLRGPCTLSVPDAPTFRLRVDAPLAHICGSAHPVRSCPSSALALSGCLSNGTLPPFCYGAARHRTPAR
ncbi:hypothetical protein B0H17DRAFT_1203860 [Mycena rosella]|uniref:Uncharacterized protein n=1 Tax=Mycena rosella TaxID=1033263 RepID=A0AAD7GFX4_MYCRO|nr:hypothetical protein B0H17DRAFT_1203860 [Mycena rosella]